MTVLEQNEEALRCLEDDFYNLYTENRTHEIESVVIEETVDGKKIICRVRDGYEWRLNSIYDTDKAAELYADRYEKIQDYSVVCIYGISDGMAIRKMLANYNETQTILIYEPDLNIFLAAMQNFLLKEIFERKNLYLVVNGINENKLNNILQNIISYQNRMMIVSCILPNYNVVYSDKCNQYLEKIAYYIKAEEFNKVTEIKYATRFADNLLYNLPYIIDHSSINELKQHFGDMNLGDVPAIVVSAGPSLDKNVRDLKAAEGKAFIIAVDSALKPLLREQIHFNIAITVDPRKNPDVFSDERIHDCPFAISGNALPLVVQKNLNRLFFEGDYGFQAYKQIIEEKTEKELGNLETGGSVATDALSLAINLGFTNIILIGQDLAFTDGRGHAAGFEKTEKENQEHMRQRHLVEVDALGGGKILTDVQMASYREWFEMKIAENRGKINIINATEGGARMHGAVEMTLKEALQEHCKREVDFDRAIQETPYAFDESDRAALYEEFMQSVSHMDQLKERLETGIEAYKGLIRLEEQQKQNTEEYRRLVEQVYEVNRIEEEDKYMELVRLYAKEVEYGAVEDIYTAEELSVKEIAERGKTLLEGYIRGIELCKEKMISILLPEMKKIRR